MPPGPLRRYPLTVLRDAEKAMRDQVHRDDIRGRRSYFAAIVRKLHDEHRRRRIGEGRAREQHAPLERDRRGHEQRLYAWRAHPARWLRDALDLIAMQWLPDVNALFADGVGYGLGHAHRALARLVELHGLVATADILRGVFATWRVSSLDRLGAHGADAVERVVLRELARTTAEATAQCATVQPSATLPLTGLFQRPPPSDRLRI